MTKTTMQARRGRALPSPVEGGSEPTQELWSWLDVLLRDGAMRKGAREELQDGKDAPEPAPEPQLPEPVPGGSEPVTKGDEPAKKETR